MKKKKALKTQKPQAYHLELFTGRDGRIRTCGLHIPNVARYRATLHPERERKGKLYNQCCKYFLKDFITASNTIRNFSSGIIFAINIGFTPIFATIA